MNNLTSEQLYELLCEASNHLDYVQLENCSSALRSFVFRLRAKNERQYEKYLNEENELKELYEK